MPEVEEIKPATEEIKPVVEAPKLIRRVIQLKDKDGNPMGGAQVFEAATEQELIDKLADAQLNATLKIRDLSRAQKLESKPLTVPEGAELDSNVPAHKPKELTADDRFRLAEKMKNPETVVEGYRELHIATTGRTPEEDATAREKSERESTLIATRNAAMAFIDAHPDYYSTPDNGKLIGQFLAARKMSTTSVRNYEIAFKELSTDGLLETAPEAPEPEVEVPVKEPRIEAAPAPKKTAIPSSLSRDRASGTATAKPKEPSAAEVAMMNADQYKAYLEGRGRWGK